jgi:hypothetical protein
MADSSRSKPGTPRVALPKIPLWKAPVPSSETAKAPPQQTARSDGKARQPVDLTAHIGARYALYILIDIIEDYKLINDQSFDYQHSLPNTRRHGLLVRSGTCLKHWSLRLPYNPA